MGTPAAGNPDPARGKAAAREALIQAAADLFAEQSDVSVRDIAARAGKNHGLVHHYFEGKHGLRRAVLDHLAAAQASRLGAVDLDDPVALAHAAVRVAREDRRYFRILARAMLDGEGDAPLQSAFPVVRRLVDTLDRGGVEGARQRVAEGLALALGWMLFEPWIRAATGLTDAESARLLDDLIETHARAYLAPTT